MDNKKTRNLIIAVIFLLGVLIITRGITYAKYVSNAVFNYYLNAKGFYFSSEQLTPDVNKIVDTTWNGNSINFKITNSTNDTLATEYDIKYKVTCTIEEENTTKVCYLNGSNTNTLNLTLSTAEGCSNYTEDGVDTSGYDEAKCKEKSYTWETKPTISDLYFDVVDLEGNDVETATVLVTATSTSPYEKTISAKYALTKDKSELGSLSLKYEDKTSYKNLIVTNSYNENKCVKLTWNPENLVIDLEDETIIQNKNENNYTNEIIFSLEKKNSKNFIFYQQDNTKIFNEENFTLVESTECK